MRSLNWLLAGSGDATNSFIGFAIIVGAGVLFCGAGGGDGFCCDGGFDGAGSSLNKSSGIVGGGAAVEAIANSALGRWVACFDVWFDICKCSLLCF